MTTSQRTFKRDPKTEALWFTVTAETHDDFGERFTSPHAAVRRHGEIIAYYSGCNGTLDMAMRSARESISGRVDTLCGIAREPDYPCSLFKGPEDL